MKNQLTSKPHAVTGFAPGSGLRQPQRRYLVLAQYFGWLVACLLGVSGRIGDSLAAEIGGDWWSLLIVLCALAGLMIGIGCGTLLYFATQNIADKTDAALDERQRWVRDRAIRRAYYVVMAIGLVLLWYVWGTLTFDLPVPNLSGAEYLPIAVIVSIMWGALPLSIVAWVEPDGAEDSDPRYEEPATSSSRLLN